MLFGPCKRLCTICRGHVEHEIQVLDDIHQECEDFTLTELKMLQEKDDVDALLEPIRHEESDEFQMFETNLTSLAQQLEHESVQAKQEVNK